MGGGGRTVSTSNRRPVFLLLVLGLAMLMFALLQLNDADPEVWVGYYAVMACACTVAAYRPLPAVLFWALAAASVAGGACLVTARRLSRRGEAARPTARPRERPRSS